MDSQSAAPALQVEDLTVSYHTPTGPFVAVDGVSFQVRPGETFGLVGESGSGKSTTAMAILQMIRPPGRIEEGRVVLDGIDLLREPPEVMRRMRWSRISYIPQGAMNALNPVMRVRDQIEDAITSHEGRQPRGTLRDRVLELLSSVGLPDRVYSMYPHELSGGMKQRVCIAMAIALRPRMIVADEPTSALDVIVQRVIAETLHDVQRQLNAGLILIGHDMGLQAQLVDRLGVMYGGRLLEIGPVRDIFWHPIHPYTRRLIAAVPSIKQRRAAASSDGLLDLEETFHLPPPRIPLPMQEIGPDHFAVVRA